MQQTTAPLLAGSIDHTLLRPESTGAQIQTLCEEAARYGFASVCVMPYYVPHAVMALRERTSSVAVCTTIGFPNGGHRTAVKMAEARVALEDGAQELDMVMNIGALKSGAAMIVEEDIRMVADVAHAGGALLKVILETSLLSDSEKRQACVLAGNAGADFVKTSTGFAGGGATIADIRLMREAVAAHVRIKASGGIRDYATALAMIDAGASRIGTSSGIAIIAEARAALAAEG